VNLLQLGFSLSISVSFPMKSPPVTHWVNFIPFPLMTLALLVFLLGSSRFPLQPCPPRRNPPPTPVFVGHSPISGSFAPFRLIAQNVQVYDNSLVHPIPKVQDFINGASERLLVPEKASRTIRDVGGEWTKPLFFLLCS